MSQPLSASEVPLDQFGRVPLSRGMKDQAAAAFDAIPEGKRAAIVVTGNTEDKTARGHFAARVLEKDGTERWKVAAGGGFKWEGEKKGHGWLAVQRSW